jgi:multiple sugar transport system ATP-binding protein
MVHLRVDAPAAVTEEVKELAADAGATAEEFAGGDERQSIVVGRFSADSQVREGETAEVAVDTRAIHFFDTETGTAIYEEGATR